MSLSLKVLSLFILSLFFVTVASRPVIAADAPVKADIKKAIVDEEEDEDEDEDGEDDDEE